MNGLLLPLALVAALGCSSEGAKTEAGDEGHTGVLALKLSAQDAQGETYRLRNAEFAVSGYSYVNGQYTYTSTSVSSETEPELPVVRANLLEGYYDVTFFDSGWYFEHTSRPAEWSWSRRRRSSARRPSRLISVVASSHLFRSRSA